MHPDEASYLTPYTVRRVSFLSYELLLLEAAHTILITDQQREQVYYLHCTPSEFVIFVRLLSAPPGYSVPLEELSPYELALTSEEAKPLRLHISRLKKKLPPSWTIRCEIDFGYRLQVQDASFSSTCCTG